MTGIQLNNFDIEISVSRDTEGLIDSGFVLADTLHQNQALILILHKGELKDDVSVGVGVSDMLLDHEIPAWRREIREQMELDGQIVNRVTVTSDGVKIDSRYGKK